MTGKPKHTQAENGVVTSSKKRNCARHCVNILQTESDAYYIEINSTITTSSSIKAEIDSFKDEIYLKDYKPHTVFASLKFPEINTNKHQVVNISQSVTITDIEAFTRFNISRIKIKLYSLNRKYGVTFKKILTVTDGYISLQEDSNSCNFNGTANIPNTSIFTLDIINLLLKPGDNILNIMATIDKLAILSAVRKKPYCKIGILLFKLLDKSVVNYSENLTYFAAALASINQTVNIDIGSIIENNLGTTVKCSYD
ncbi:hypothetical protein EDB80DRAFT_752877 [Ilyonectria destructans]|nr:hypothetical protein EDB80DRAFT_752877 [Ilyonectria destructans]